MLAVLMDSTSNIQITPQDLVTNPDYYLWRFDGEHAIFSRMNRETYRQSIFTDQRIVSLDPKPVGINLDELAQVCSSQKQASSNISFIFHVAHCGSTLLARALDIESKNIVYREPYVLRQLSVLLADNNWGNSPPILWKKALELSTNLLGKSYIKGAPVIIKANVPVNFAIDNLMEYCRTAKGILLYATFDNYLLSILKSANHRSWVSNISSTLGSLIGQNLGISKNEIENLSVAQKAACLWLAQIKIFNDVSHKYKHFQTLDAELFFSNPAQVLSASFQLFGNDVNEEEIDSIVRSELFSRHAKIPGQKYDNESRIKEKNRLLQSISSELNEAREWLLTKTKDSPLPDRLPHSLIGKSPRLFEDEIITRAFVENVNQPDKVTCIDTQVADSGYMRISPDEKISELEDIADELIIEGFKQHGAILFRGFEYNVELFSNFVKRFCTHSVFNPSFGREVIDAHNNIQTVDLGDGAFPLHAELCREPWRPDVCFFTCETAPEDGGETTICDGVKIVEALDKGVIDQLQSQALRYYQPMSTEDCKQWLNSEQPSIDVINNPPDNCPFQLTLLEGQLTRVYDTQALHYTMFGNHLAFGNFLLFSRYGLKNRLQPCFVDGSIVPDEAVAEVKRTSDILTVSHRWEKGDLLMLDNTRFLHGRNAILNIDERRIISYFGYLNFAELDADAASAVWRKNPHAHR